MSQNQPEKTEDNSVELAKFSKERFRYGLWAVGFGVAALAFGFALTLLQIGQWDPDKGLALFGAMTAPLVAIVTAYFGIQATQQVAQPAQKQAATAQQQAGEAEQRAASAQQQAGAAEAAAARAPEKVLATLEAPVRSALARALQAEPPQSAGQSEVLGEGDAAEGWAADEVDQRTAVAWEEIRRAVERRLG